MPNAQYEIFIGLAKSAEAVNIHLQQFHDLLELIEAMIRKQPELVRACNAALFEQRNRFSPGPQTRLLAVREAIECLPD